MSQIRYKQSSKIPMQIFWLICTVTKELLILVLFEVEGLNN